MTQEFLLAGFGGQGILFSGKYLAYVGLLSGKQVSWLPSYGPEMRGGTANCSVILSDDMVGSPIVAKPDVLVAMNKPSFEKYEGEIKSGGIVFYDSSLISAECTRTDITYVAVPATTLAGQNDIEKLANMIMIGKVLDKLNMVNDELTEKVLGKCISARRQSSYASNLRALSLGAESGV